MMFEAIKNRAAFIPFVVAGFPSLDETEKLVDILVEEGADIIELGVPFSDALADGPVIQKASESTALKVPALTSVLELALALRRKHPQLGLVLFSYFNPILKMGFEAFAKLAQKSGIDTVLTVDLPPEEAADYLKALKAAGLGTAFLVSPTTARERLPLIQESSTSFIYYVSRAGVTGVQKELSPTLRAELEALRQQVSRPIVVGFGIASGAQARQVAPHADGVAIGSAFVKIIDETPDIQMRRERIRSLARELKQNLTR